VSHGKAWVNKLLGKTEAPRPMIPAASKATASTKISMTGLEVSK
jgi:hypothetical protein